MSLLTVQELWAFKNKLSQLQKDVILLYFSAETNCRHCLKEKILLTEMTEMHSRLHLELFNLEVHRKIANRYGVDKVPGIVIAGEKDFGVKYYGIPSEIEMHTLIEDVLMVSTGESGLSRQSKEKLASLDVPVHLEVFSGPTCIFSRRAIRLSHQLAVESDLIAGDAVDIAEFPDLVEKYKLRASPTIQVNREYQFYEPVSNEDMFIDEVFKGVNPNR